MQGISELIKKIAVMRGIIPDPVSHAEPHEAGHREAALMTPGFEQDPVDDLRRSDPENRA